MTILQNIQNNSQKKIINSFKPFQKPEEIEGMIIGNDLDSLISSSFLKKLFGWNILGIYDLESLWYSGTVNDFDEKLRSGRIIAVDLDIYHQQIPSIGHHILALTSDDLIPGHSMSLNPNLIRGIHRDHFRSKYPLSTIHFLIWLFGVGYKLNQESRDLIWLADSSYINGQSHRFRDNVEEWLMNFFKDEQFSQSLDEIDTLKFEERISEMLPFIKKTGLQISRGQVKSRHLKLSGFQCQWQNPNIERNNILTMFNLIKDITGWAEPLFPENFIEIKGNRKYMPVYSLFKNKISLDDFLEIEGIFSYVFPNYRTINYTKNIIFDSLDSSNFQDFKKGGISQKE